MIVDLEFGTVGEAEMFHEKLQAMWAERGASLGLESPRGRIVEVADSQSY